MRECQGRPGQLEDISLSISIVTCMLLQKIGKIGKKRAKI